jgi:hypothetical protein
LCPKGVEPSTETCKFDNYGFYYDSVSQYPYRIGNYMQSEVKYLNIGGNFKWLTIPGELCPELATGLPQDFDTPAATAKYFQQPNEHAVGKAYTMPGAVMSMMQCDDANPCWVTGLTQDQAGYMFPISDWRIKCTAGANCTYLYQIGALNFTGMRAQLLLFVVKQSVVNYYQDHDTDCGLLVGSTNCGRLDGWKCLQVDCRESDDCQAGLHLSIRC